MGQNSSKIMETIGDASCGYAKVTTIIGIVIFSILFIIFTSLMINTSMKYDYDYVTVINDPNCNQSVSKDNNGTRVSYICNDVNVRLKDGTVINNLTSNSGTNIRNNQQVYASISKTDKYDVYLLDYTLYIYQIASGVLVLFIFISSLTLFFLYRSPYFCKLYGAISAAGAATNAMTSPYRYH